MKNIILLTIDALRRDALGCYSKNNLTPFIDSIQNRSIRFNNAYSVGPYTQAAFPGILSSSYYLDFGRPKGRCPAGRVLISQVLNRGGIETAAIHSNPYLCDFFGWNKGWDYFYDSMDEDVSDEVPYIKASEINTRAYDWLKQHTAKKGNTPFFLWVHYMDVHEPYVPDRKFLDLAAPELDTTAEQMMDLFNKVLLKRDVSHRGSIDLLYKLYQAHTLEIDQAARSFFEILSDLGLDHSLVIITSDHGDEFNEHGGLSHDGKMYEELVHVPLIIYDPSFHHGTISDTTVSTLDIPPTITHLFNLHPDPGWQGESLLPLKDKRSKGGVFGEAIDKHGNKEKGDEAEVHFYCEDHFKLIYTETNHLWELYNLKHDPEESTNLFDSSMVTQDMMKRIISRVRRSEKR